MTSHILRPSLHIAAVVVVLWASATAASSSPGQLLRLKAGSWDPAREGAPVVGLDGAAATGAPDLHLVQHRGPIPAGYRAALASCGAEILGYVADHAYLVRLHPARLADVRALGGTRAVTPYVAGLRIDPALLDSSLVPAPTRPEALLVRVWGTVGAALEPLAARAQEGARGAALVGLYRTGSGRPLVILDIAPGLAAESVEVLAHDPEVEFLEPVGRLVTAGAETAWVTQSGTSMSWPLFSQEGLTGVGQIVSLADIGLDHDACQFKFDAGGATPADPTQPPGVGTLQPGNKVVAYYLLTGADDEDAAATGYHGSRVAGSIAGDDFASLAPRTPPYTFPTPQTSDGVAPGAQLVMQDIGDADGFLVAGINQDSLMTQAYRSGSRVHNSSYGEAPEDTGQGPNNRYLGETAVVDDMLWRTRDLSAVFAAGNFGQYDPNGAPWDGSRSLLGIGAVAKNTVTVGASGNPSAPGENLEFLLPESSRGPTQEGLWKPDVVAPGHDITPIGSTQPGAVCNADRLQFLGSSFAAGAVSGASALVRQYFVEGFFPSGARSAPDGFNPSNALVKAVLINAARSLTGTNTGDTNTQLCGLAPPWTPGCSAPSFGQGWGRVTLADTLSFNRPGEDRFLNVLHDIWNGSQPLENQGRGSDPQPKGAITNDEVHNYAIRLVSATKPLRCTLSWSDPAGSPASAVPLVNDLDLEIHDPGPDGIVGNLDDRYFHGNRFFDDRPYSDPADTGWDALNAVENVWIEMPGPGVHNIRVRGRSVPGNGRRDVQAQPETAGSPTLINSTLQGYALLCSGDASQTLSPPLVSASVMPNPAVGCFENNPVFQFDVTSCTASSPPCVDFEWDMGDGTTLTGQSVMYSYAAPGLYKVSVTVRDSAGVEGQLSFPLEVIVGTQDPAGKVGNTLKLGKLRPSNPPVALATWADIGVPAATSYNLYEHTDKRDLSMPTPPVPPINTPPLPLHGTPPGYPWRYPTTQPRVFLEVRAANCLGQPGP